MFTSFILDEILVTFFFSSKDFQIIKNQYKTVMYKSIILTLFVWHLSPWSTGTCLYVLMRTVWSLGYNFIFSIFLFILLIWTCRYVWNKLSFFFSYYEFSSKCFKTKEITAKYTKLCHEKGRKRSIKQCEEESKRNFNVI